MPDIVTVVGVPVGVALGVDVAVGVGVGVGVDGVGVGVAGVGVETGVEVAVAVGVALGVGVGVGVPVPVISSAPMSGVLGSLGLLSKSFVIPAMGVALPLTGDDALTCRLTVVAVPVGLINCGSAEMLFASFPVAVCQFRRVS